MLLKHSYLRKNFIKIYNWTKLTSAGKKKILVSCEKKINLHGKQQASSRKCSAETAVKSRPKEVNRFKHVTVPLSIFV